MADKKKSGVIIAVMWSFIQRGGSIVISFALNIILARLLFPEDFGTIGLVLVFSSLADTLVDAGLGSALIQKESISKNEISTVFTSNIAISILLFVLLFIIAPGIEEYLNIENFALYLRVQSTTVLLRAFYIVEFSLLNRRLRFKDLATINIVSSLFSAITAISLASMGFGVWSLIIKNISLHILLVGLYKYYIKVKTKILFDKSAFYELFSFGGYITLTYFLDFIYSNTVSFLLGKQYSVKDLGYYTQAKSLQQIPINTLSLVVGQVMFPFFSKFKNDRNKVIDSMDNTVSVISFLIFPVVFFIMLFAKPIIILLFSEKWLPSVWMFQVLCISGMVNALVHANRNLLKSLGYTKVLFFTQLVTLTVGLICIIIGINFSLQVLLALIVINSYLEYLAISIVVHFKVNYYFIQQLSKITVNFIISALTVSITYFSTKNLGLSNNFIYLVINFLVMLILYVGVHRMLNTKPFDLVLNLIVTKK